MSIDRYITFNITDFLKDYYKHKDMIDKLQEEYDALDGVSAISINADKVQTSSRPDALEKVALERVNLSARIQDYKQDIKTVEIAFKLLNEDERAVIDSYYGGKQVDIPASRTQLYRIRTEAVKKLSLWICNTDKTE